MPVILTCSNISRWLSNETKIKEEIQEILVPYPAEHMLSYAIDKAVGNVKNTGPELIAAVSEGSNGIE